MNYLIEYAARQKKVRETAKKSEDESAVSRKYGGVS